MGVNTAAGATISIGTTASSGATDTYTAIGSVTNIPEFGRVYSEIKFMPLGTRGVQKFKGSYDDGDMTLELGRDTSDAGQAAALVARDSDSDYNFKITVNDANPATSAAVTVTIASPGVFTDTAHGLAANTPVSFSTTGALPTGLTAGTTYYVVSPTTNNYSVAATSGGSAITTTGTQSGTHTRTTVPQGSSVILKAKVMSYTMNVGTLDQVVAAKIALSIKSGSIVETARIP